MDDTNLKLLKEGLTAQLDSCSFNDVSKDILNHVTNKDHKKDELIELNNNILSAKNDWEYCVDALENQAIIILDDALKVIRVNKTIELWGWADVKKVAGMHILNLIQPALEHDSVNNWINEWCQLDTQANAEWVSNNFKSGKTFLFSYYPNKDIDSTHHNGNYYAVMLVTDISNQKVLSSQKNKSASNLNSLSAESDDNDYIRLSAYRLHQLSSRLIQSQEDERKRISSELHDGLGQTLSALKYQVEAAVIGAKENFDAGKNVIALNNVLKSATAALAELRRISVELRPSILEDLGILMTLKWFTNEYNKVYADLNIDLQFNIVESDIPDENKSIIYRIVQESMNNIAKHSDAKNIFIHLTKSESGVLLRITDDGCGFDLKKVLGNKKSGLGLKTMEERAVNSGAKFTMNSSVSSGTVVQVFWNND